MPQGNAGQRILSDIARRTAMFSTRAHHIFLQLSRAEELSTPRADGASRRRQARVTSTRYSLMPSR